VGPLISINDAMEKYGITEQHVLQIERPMEIYDEHGKPLLEPASAGCCGVPLDLSGQKPECKKCGKMGPWSIIAHVAGYYGECLSWNAERLKWNAEWRPASDLEKEAKEIKDKKGVDLSENDWTYIALRRLRVEEHVFEEALFERHPEVKARHKANVTASQLQQTSAAPSGTDGKQSTAEPASDDVAVGAKAAKMKTGEPVDEPETPLQEATVQKTTEIQALQSNPTMPETDSENQAAKGIFCWVVQDECKLTEEQCTELLQRLDSIPGAIQECSAWCSEGKIPIHSDMRRSKSVLVRGYGFLEDLLRLEIPDAASHLDGKGSIAKPCPRFLLRNVIHVIYKGEKPEKEKIPDMLPEKPEMLSGMERASFIKAHLWPLYCDSLQLRRSDVRAWLLEDPRLAARAPEWLMREDAPQLQQPSTKQKPIFYRFFSGKHEPAEQLPADLANWDSLTVDNQTDYFEPEQSSAGPVNERAAAEEKQRAQAIGSPAAAQTTKAPSQPKQNLWNRFVESILQGAGNELGRWLLYLFGFIILLGVGGVVYFFTRPPPPIIPPTAPPLGAVLPPAPDAPGWHLIAHRFSREAWEEGGAYAVYTKEGERFDLSKAQWIRVTFEASQAGTKFFLRLLPKGEIPDASTGVYKEVLSIPAEGVVVLPLKPTDFLLKPADLHQLIQISVHSGDNAWGEPLGQEPSKRAKFEKIEVYTP